jgi:hypothetical protein
MDTKLQVQEKTIKYLSSTMGTKNNNNETSQGNYCVNEKEILNGRQRPRIRNYSDFLAWNGTNKRRLYIWGNATERRLPAKKKVEQRRHTKNVEKN